MGSSDRCHKLVPADDPVVVMAPMLVRTVLGSPSAAAVVVVVASVEIETVLGFNNTDDEDDEAYLGVGISVMTPLYTLIPMLPIMSSSSSSDEALPFFALRFFFFLTLGRTNLRAVMDTVPSSPRWYMPRKPSPSLVIASL